MDIATIVGFLSAFVLVLLAMGAMGDPTVFINMPSMLFVVGGTVALTLFSFPLQNVISSFRYFGYTVIPPKPGADQSKVIGELEIGIVMFTKIKSYAQATGWVGSLNGLVLILTSIDDPAAIGPSASLALLTVFYGTLIAYWICLPVSTKLQFRLDELKKAS